MFTTNIRFQTLNVREVVSKILGLNVENFQINEYNRYQYPFYISYGHINVYYHDKDIKAGVLIEMSGQACREMEYEFEYHQKQRTWYDFFNDCFLYANKKAPDNDDFVKIILHEHLKSENEYLYSHLYPQRPLNSLFF